MYNYMRECEFTGCKKKKKKNQSYPRIRPAVGLYDPESYGSCLMLDLVHTGEIETHRKAQTQPKVVLSWKRPYFMGLVSTEGKEK